MNVLVEAIGSPGWPTLIPYLRSVFRRIIGLEVDPLVAQARLVDRCHLVPRYADLAGPELFLALCAAEKVDIVFPTIDEGLPFWSQHRAAFEERGIAVVLPPDQTIALFQDKWQTYGFFRDHGIPTPETSLAHDYDLVKPRRGRGGAGVRRAPPGTIAEMGGLISQRALSGQELSIDVLCDRKGRCVYKVQRERLETASGISVRSRVVFLDEVDRHVDRILAATPFFGIANLQCFVEPDGVYFTDINTRIPGGLSLSMAATENWFAVLLKLLRSLPIETLEVRRGLVMLRHFRDVFVGSAETAGRNAPLGDADTQCRHDEGEFSSLPVSAPSTTSSSR